MVSLSNRVSSVTSVVDRYVLVGLTLMIVSESATLARIEPFFSWNTPICWTGFILFADAVVFRARGNSWMRSSPRELAALALVSIPLWLVFEFFNRFIDNWHYIGLSENALLRYFGYAWSFATIWPAIFEGAELVAVWRGGASARGPREVPGSPTRQPRRGGGSESSSAAARASGGGAPRALGKDWQISGFWIALGAAMLVWPLVRPSRYLAAPVWLGFIFLLDPINARLGGSSLWADVREGRADRVTNLALSGLLCGALWEFWNYWAGAKWQYTVPIMARAKIFEMPLPGYFGFPPFALECFTMYVFVRLLWTRWRAGDTAELGRMIAL